MLSLSANVAKPAKAQQLSVRTGERKSDFFKPVLNEQTWSYLSVFISNTTNISG